MKGYDKHDAIWILLNCLKFKICFWVFCLRQYPIFESQKDYDDQLFGFGLFVLKMILTQSLLKQDNAFCFINSYTNSIMRRIFVLHGKNKDSIRSQFFFWDKNPK